MTVFVTKSNRAQMTEPIPVSATYASGENLHHLVAMNPDAIYFTDDTSSWDHPNNVSLTERVDITYDVWERDNHHPTAPPRPYREDVGYPTARSYAKAFNKEEAWRGRYTFFPVRVTTTRKFEEI